MESKRTIANPADEIMDLYRTGIRFAPNNPGAVISFQARHLSDATLAHVGLVADYIQPIDAVAENYIIPPEGIAVWDGRGGGLKDTGIHVAPGDEVHIWAGGEVCSGMWFAGTHGPEGGWPGPKAQGSADESHYST